jgi:hypothetical protein
MSTNTCSSCRWFKNDTCYANPPIPQLVMAQSLSGPQPQAIGMRPPVAASDFCSKWEAEQSRLLS